MWIRMRIWAILTNVPGALSHEDLCVRRRWHHSQQIADRFRRRWTREYLPTLIRRQKWTEDTRSMQIGDVVLVAEGWSLAPSPCNWSVSRFRRASEISWAEVVEWHERQAGYQAMPSGGVGMMVATRWWGPRDRHGDIRHTSSQVSSISALRVLGVCLCVEDLSLRWQCPFGDEEEWHCRISYRLLDYRSAFECVCVCGGGSVSPRWRRQRLMRVINIFLCRSCAHAFEMSTSFWMQRFVFLFVFELINWDDSLLSCIIH